MEQDHVTRQKNYERASLLLGELFKVDSDITGQINTCIQQYGVGIFFKNLENFDFSRDVLGKLEAVRMVLFGIGVETAMTDTPEPESLKGGAKL